MSIAAANLPDLAHFKMEHQRSPQVLALIKRARERVVVRQVAGIERSEAMRDFHANYAAIVEAL